MPMAMLQIFSVPGNRNRTADFSEKPKRAKNDVKTLQAFNAFFLSFENILHFFPFLSDFEKILKGF